MKCFLLAILAVIALSGCAAKSAATGPEILVCTAEGKTTYRSAPSKWWWASEGTWYAQSPRQAYRQSAWESCRVEAESADQGERGGAA